jgi:hypothetical protein
MNNKTYTHQTEPDERGNVFHIESEQEIGHRIIREAITWYSEQPHHKGATQPESNRHIRISTLEIPGGSHRAWNYL